MSPQSVRWLGIILPLLFWSILLIVKQLLMGSALTPLDILVELGAVAVGSALFANLVANRLERHEAELTRRSAHLDALRNAALNLTSELELSQVLQRVVDLSRQLVSARYGALAVVESEQGRIEQFITAGISAELRSQMGELPHGRGLLGALIKDKQPVLVADMATDPRSAGFPDRHPPMRSLVGVPILYQGKVLGNLYLTDKREELPSGGNAVGAFTHEDVEILQMFAAHAAVAIVNARLHRENQQLAVLKECERIGMDLHDGVIQSIFAIGLMLDSTRHQLPDVAESTRTQIGTAMTGLNEVISDIRGYILGLRPRRFQDRDLVQGLEQLAVEVRTTSSLAVELTVDPALDRPVGGKPADELLHIAQEALANIRKHAGASTVQIGLTRRRTRLMLTIEDDGAGFDPAQGRPGGNGLRNMRNRTHSLGGDFEIFSTAGDGTQIIVTVPVTP
jgi:signal transduction histidine kinase